ncbi:hypothetical protein LTR56_010651 [Elasticomyces elasticus]|nr:hypothetical protein LTR56_010651 [Elasticomyces elasticus]KAK5751529.1 hypothetical protein LTS12_018371 [Elasticomyces elasticus]
MSSPITTEVLLARNKRYIPSHQRIGTLAELGPVDGFPHILVVTCCDPRCIPENFLGLTTLDAITIRNAGGNVEMALANVVALDTLVDFRVRGVLGERAPGKKAEIEKMELGSIAGKTLEQGLREQVGAVKASDLVKDELKSKIRAFVYDIASGDLTEVAV